MLKTEKQMTRSSGNCGTAREGLTSVSMELQKRRRRKWGKDRKSTWANMVTDINLQVQADGWTLNWIKAKKSIPSHMIIKLLNTNAKRKDYQPRILHWEKTSFSHEGKIKTFLDEEKLRQICHPETYPKIMTKMRYVNRKKMVTDGTLEYQGRKKRSKQKYK